MFRRLSDEWREFWHERAAIREFCGGEPRDKAEKEAWYEMMAARRAKEEARR